MWRCGTAPFSTFPQVPLRNDDRDAAPAAVDVQVDDVAVELGFGEVESHTAQIGADMCFPGELPSPSQAQPSDTALDLQGLGQPPVRAGECDGSRQRQDDRCEFGFGPGGEQPGNAGVKLARVDVACCVQLLEELSGTVLGIVLAHNLASGCQRLRRAAQDPASTTGTGAGVMAYPPWLTGTCRAKAAGGER